jgi:hypothetical protein
MVDNFWVCVISSKLIKSLTNRICKYYSLTTTVDSLRQLFFASNISNLLDTTMSGNSEQTSFCARYPEQSLNIAEHSEHKLNMYWTDSEHRLNMYWTDSEHYWTLLKILNRFWTWTEQSLNITEHSEHRLNMYWTDSEHYWTLMKILNRFWTFWTWTEQSLNITEHSEHRLNRFWILLKILNRFISH